MSESIWSDEPPNEPGWYYVKYRIHGTTQCRKLNVNDPQFMSYIAKYVQFGPRVPDAMKCAEIERGSDVLQKQT